MTASNGEYDDRVFVFWNTVVDGATRYDVFRTPDGGSTTQVGFDVANNTFSDFGAQAGVLYAYHLRAKRGTLASDQRVDW